MVEEKKVKKTRKPANRNYRIIDVDGKEVVESVFKTKAEVKAWLEKYGIVEKVYWLVQVIALFKTGKPVMKSVIEEVKG